MRSLRLSRSHQLLASVTTYLLDLVLFDFQLPESGIHYLPASANLSHFLFSDVIKRHFTFSQHTPFQLPTLPRISLSTRPDSSKTLALYKSCTYLLTCLIMKCTYRFPSSKHLTSSYKSKLRQQQDAQLSQRDRAAGCVIVFAKSKRLELRDNILRTV